MFSDLSQKLKSQQSEDKIRALYPLLFNTPCEDQGDLFALVNDVADASAKLEQETRIIQSSYTMGSADQQQVVHITDPAFIRSFTPRRYSRPGYGPGSLLVKYDTWIEPLPPV